MKLSDETLNILKNFATINKAIEVKAGNVLATISPAKTIFAKTTVPENFEVGFAIYELPKFLGALSLFGEPTLDFKDKYVTISEGSTKIRYTYCDPSTIVTAPSKEIKLPDVVASFDVKSSSIAALMKSLGVLGLPEIMVHGDGTAIYLSAANSKNQSADEFSVKVADSEAEFKVYFNKENFKLLDRDYEVSVSKSGLAEFKSGDLKYFVIGAANT
jgi:hypothetical protein